MTETMSVCSDGHDEIVYIGKVCTACVLLKEIEEQTDDLAKANTRISELESEVEELWKN